MSIYMHNDREREQKHNKSREYVHCLLLWIHVLSVLISGFLFYE